MSEAEKILGTILADLVECFGVDAAENMKELVAHGESGVALEVICSQLVEFDIAIPFDVKRKIELAEEIMEMKIEEIKYLKTL